MQCQMVVNSNQNRVKPWAMTNTEWDNDNSKPDIWTHSLQLLNDAEDLDHQYLNGYSTILFVGSHYGVCSVDIVTCNFYFGPLFWCFRVKLPLSIDSFQCAILRWKSMNQSIRRPLDWNIVTPNGSQIIERIILHIPIWTKYATFGNLATDYCSRIWSSLSSDKILSSKFKVSHKSRLG